MELRRNERHVVLRHLRRRQPHWLRPICWQGSLEHARLCTSLEHARLSTSLEEQRRRMRRHRRLWLPRRLPLRSLRLRVLLLVLVLCLVRRVLLRKVPLRLAVLERLHVAALHVVGCVLSVARRSAAALPVACRSVARCLNRAGHEGGHG